MPSWGITDAANLTGTVATTTASADVIGNGTIFLTEVRPGDYIIVDGVKYQVWVVADDLNLSITRGAEANVSGEVVTLQTGPKYIPDVPLEANTYSIQRIVGSVLEETVTPDNRARNVKQTGWYNTMEYVDGTGQQRYKNELLVALSKDFNEANAGDADGAEYPDAIVTIDTQPVDSSNVDGLVTFFVEASVAGNAIPLYQWQMSGDNVVFIDLEDDAVFSGTTTNTLEIVYDTSLDGGFYRVQVGVDGLPDITSNVAQIV